MYSTEDTVARPSKTRTIDEPTPLGESFHRKYIYICTPRKNERPNMSGYTSIGGSGGKTMEHIWTRTGQTYTQHS